MSAQADLQEPSVNTNQCCPLLVQRCVCINLLIRHVGAFDLFQNQSCDWADCWSEPSLASVFHEDKRWWDEYQQNGQQRCGAPRCECHVDSAAQALFCHGVTLWFINLSICVERKIPLFQPGFCTSSLCSATLDLHRGLFVIPAMWKVCFVLWLLFHDCCFTTRFAGMGNLLKVLTREIENYPHFFLDFESKSGTGVERMEKGWMEKEEGGFPFFNQ